MLCCAALSTYVFFKNYICMYECSMCLLKRFEYLLLFIYNKRKEGNTSHPFKIYT